ncbi:MAG: LysR family transcriptional regulator, partial [Oscillospiraceae bacterium]|nr:LysR family transcriptional regulator [Oscillospiraceae bacterium]
MTHLEIEAFLEVVRCGTISGAAKQLYVTQPALSHRIRTLEGELGYQLIERGRGHKSVELTEQGRAFMPVAEKWLAVWREARSIERLDNGLVLNLESIVSVSTYILGPALRRFLREDDRVRVKYQNCRSIMGYEDVAMGMADLAFISDNMFRRRVETVPAFREPMVLVMNRDKAPEQPVHPTMLDPAREVRMPWNPECDQWHDYWFGADAMPTILLDHMAWMEDLLQDEGAWAVMPTSVARRLSGAVHRCPMVETPPDRIIYYLR